MSNINLIDSFQEFKDFKNIDRPTMMSVLEDVFRSMIRKKYGTDENCDVIVNTDNGDLEIWRTRTPNFQVTVVRINNYVAIFVGAIFFPDHASENVFQHTHHRRAID